MVAQPAAPPVPPVPPDLLQPPGFPAQVQAEIQDEGHQLLLLVTPIVKAESAGVMRDLCNLQSILIISSGMSLLFPTTCPSFLIDYLLC